MDDESVPALARALFAELGEAFDALDRRVRHKDVQLAAWHRADTASRRLSRIPGIGPLGAVMLSLKTPDPRGFGSGRQFAAWLGLTPKDHSTAGRQRLGVITRAGDEALRAVLVAGAMAVIQHKSRGKGRPWPWLEALLARKSPKHAAVALANKMARIAWKLMVTGEEFNPGRALSAMTPTR